MSELLDCPFCDADYQSVGYNISEQVVECGCCGAIGPDTMFGANNRESAITAWNTRAPSMPIDERAEFEAWSMSFPHMAEQATRNTEYPDQYEDITMQIEWQAWQARSALGSLK